MNIQIQSDLHLDLRNDGGKKYIASMDETDVDVLVLAGDIISTSRRESARSQKALTAICKKYKSVVYVPGNHEFWGSSLTDGWATIDIWATLIPNLHVLKPGKGYIQDNVSFIGDTLWFEQTEETLSWRRSWPDYTQILGFNEELPVFHDTAKVWLDTMMTKDMVVVTHHMPHPKSIHPKYARELTNMFFLTDMSDVIAKHNPKLWIHGHTHEKFDYLVGETRIVCNPLGYVYESTESKFDPRKIIEL